MPRHVLIVSREDRDLYAYIADRFRDDPTIEVILDRRFGARRRTVMPVAAERRQQNRRLRPDVDEELRLRSHVIVTLTSELEGVEEARQWLEMGFSRLPVISGVLRNYNRLWRETEASKQEAGQLRAEVGRLRAEIEQYRSERDDTRVLVARMNEILGDLLSWLRGRSV